jgi:phage-related protein
VKPIVWVGSSKKDLRSFPDRVQDIVGRSLLDVQFGEKPANAKILHGFGGAAVLELVDNYDGDAYRAVLGNGLCSARLPEEEYEGKLDSKA